MRRPWQVRPWEQWPVSGWMAQQWEEVLCSRRKPLAEGGCGYLGVVRACRACRLRPRLGAATSLASAWGLGSVLVHST